MCDCLKRRCWEPNGGAGQLSLIKEGKRKAAVCWHLVTASHYCTDAMEYELMRLPQFGATVSLHCFNPAVVGRGRTGSTLTVLSFSQRYRRLELGHGLCLQIREQQGGQSDGLPILSQDRCLSGLVTSNTIYISNRFSCKLHASTLTKTKDRTINYRQIQVH